MIRNATRVFAALAATVTGIGALSAAPFQDQLVQAPSIGQPQRGSIAGSLSKLSFGAADLARGAYSLPLPVEVPDQRGGLLARLFPSYSTEGSQSEWGMGWSSELAITRHRVLGDLQYDDSDDFSSPWGRLVPGDDGDYYPAGLRHIVRVHRTAAGAGWQVTTQDGTIYTFLAADSVTNGSGTYAWMLSRVDSLHGDSTRLTWARNDSGRRFLESVKWGGRNDGTQYQATLAYETLPKPFISYASGAKLTLDRRITQISLGVRQGASYVERWRYDLGYKKSPLGPAFYLERLTRTFATGASEPPVTYDYDMGVEQLATATLAPQPALDFFLASAGATAIQPDHASMTDLEENGLTDLEHYYSFTMVKQTEDGFVFEPLPARTGGENPLCRPDASILNKPRLLARMRSGLGGDPQVVVVRKNGVGSTTTLTFCDRPGFTQGTPPTVGGNWELGANTRLADVDLDFRPDFVRVYNGGVQVLRNFSSDAQWSFLPMPAQVLTPAVSATASWVLDFNGDGKPDIMSRTSSGVLVWLGTGAGRFEQVGRAFLFRTVAGVPLANVNEHQFSHGDFNGDGLTDVILSKAQSAYVYLNQGDEFQQRAVPGLASIPFSFGYPIVGDLTASGNPEVLFVDGSHARTIALRGPSTGLLRRADDGKGTIIKLGYKRVRPEPGIIQRYALLAEMTVESTGYDPVTYRYDYAQAVWHSIGHYLVGFVHAKKVSPFLSEDVTFHNDDDVAGVVTGTTSRDGRTPAIEKFSAQTLEPASFHGIPWKRQKSTTTGMRGVDGSNPLATEVTYQAYTHEICPTRVATSLPGGTLVKLETLAEVPALDPELHCLPASQRLSGSHAGDASLDFDYSLGVVRDELGQVTRIAQAGPQGPLVLQENVYDANGRVIQTGAPGRGVPRAGYDGFGRLVDLVTPAGVATHAGIDPVSDAFAELRTDRGGGATTSVFFGYDNLDRLERSWDDFSGSSAARPTQQLGYRFASGQTPGAVTVATLADAASGAVSESTEITAADGAQLGKALWTGEWVVSGLVRTDRTSNQQTGFVRTPIGGYASLTSMTMADLYGAGATPLTQTTNAGFGYPTEASNVFQAGVTGTTAISWRLAGTEIIERTVKNGTAAREVGKDAAGRIVRIRDEQGAEYHFVYDVLGRLARVITPDGTQRLAFDGYGRPAEVARDGLASFAYRYDPATGLATVKQVCDGQGSLVRTASSEYDAIGRPLHVEHVRGEDGAKRDYWFEYDGAGAEGPGTIVAGQRGQLSRVSTPGFERREKFDRAGRLASSTLVLGDGWRRVENVPSYRADGTIASSRVIVKDGAGAVLLDSQRTTIVDAYGREAGVAVDGHNLYTLTYDAESRIERASFADGHELVFDHDPVTHERRGYHIEGPVQDGGVAWELDDRGKIAAEIFTSAGNPDRRDYRYDARGFLVEAHDDTGTARYAYDHSGLPESASDVAGPRALHRAGDVLDVGGVTYHWDALGRVIQKGDLTLEYGPNGELESARRPGAVMSFVSDEVGKRVLKRVDGVPVLAYVGAGVLTDEAFVEPVQIGGVTVGILQNGAFPPLLTDPRGTPTLDASGAPYLATPYGLRLEHAGFAVSLDFTRLGYDADLGTVRMGARDYDPRLSQFTTPDPLFLERLDKCQQSPVECNLFGYAGNDPLEFADPSGNASVEVTIHQGPPAEMPKLQSGQLLLVTRTYAPFKTFGGGFEGDNRGPSQKLNETARIHTWTVIDFKSSTAESWVWSSPSHAKGLFAETISGPSTATAKPTLTSTSDFSYDSITVSQHYMGANPLVAGSPDIDVHTTTGFELEPKADGTTNLKIFGRFSGDRFPNTESFIVDPEGNTVRLGDFQTSGGAMSGPFSRLAGDNNKDMAKFQVTVPVDMKKGTFENSYMRSNHDYDQH